MNKLNKVKSNPYYFEYSVFAYRLWHRFLRGDNLSYSVFYGKTGSKGNRFVRYIFIAASLSLTLSAICIVWPRGRGVILEILFPNGGNQTAEAFAFFASNLKNGQDFFIAFRIFCEKVLENVRFV